MNLSTLKRNVLAAFPVVGPHTNIEADLMLAGKKPITWCPLSSDESEFYNLTSRIEHEGRKRLDIAVAEGKLVAIDVERIHPDFPDHIGVARHYAQPDNAEALKRVAKFNKQAFNAKDLSQIKPDKDMGYYLGYKRRDILFFDVIESPLFPVFLKHKLIQLNEPCQNARRDQLLLEAGYDLKEWHDNLPRLDNM